jgi:hypothetical protein
MEEMRDGSILNFKNGSKKLKMEKLIFIFIILGLSLNCVFSQESNTNLSIGLNASVNQIHSKKFKDSPVFINLGITSEYKIRENYILQLTVSHSTRKYNIENREIETFYTEQYGIQAFYSSSTSEKIIELQNLIKYNLSPSKRVSPFVGLGYVFQFTYSLNGNRGIEHKDEVLEIFNMTDNIGYPGNLSSYTNFGLKPNFGLYLDLADKLNVIFSVGYSFYFQSNLSTYGYPNENESDNRHDELNFGLSIIYDL